MRENKATEYVGEAISYIRFSSGKQADGDSLRRQTKATEEYCQKHKLKLVDKLPDLGISGYKGDNVTKGKLGIFLDEVKRGKIKKNTYLIVEALDRLSREDIDVQQVNFLSLIQNGINIVTLTDNQVYHHSKHPQKKSGQELMTQLIITLSLMLKGHAESADKSRRVKAAWSQKTDKAMKDKKPMTQMCPQWIRLDTKKDKYVIVPERGKVVKRIFKLYSQGFGYSAIATKLLNDSTPIFTTLNNTKRDVTWNQRKIENILKSPAIYGSYYSRRKDFTIDDYYPAIMTKDEYFAIMGSQKKRCEVGGETQKFLNVLRGLCKCGDCGKDLVFTRTYRDQYLKCGKCRKSTARYSLAVNGLVKALSYNIGQYVYNQDETVEAQHRSNEAIEAQVAIQEKKIDTLNLSILETDDVTEMLETKKLVTLLRKKVDDLKKDIVVLEPFDSPNALFGEDILLDGFLEKRDNRMNLNKFLHQLIPNGVGCYKHSANAYSMYLEIGDGTKDRLHLFIRRENKTRPWRYHWVEVSSKEEDPSDKVKIEERARIGFMHMREDPEDDHENDHLMY